MMLLHLLLLVVVAAGPPIAIVVHLVVKLLKDLLLHGVRWATCSLLVLAKQGHQLRLLLKVHTVLRGEDWWLLLVLRHLRWLVAPAVEEWVGSIAATALFHLLLLLTWGIVIVVSTILLRAWRASTWEHLLGLWTSEAIPTIVLLAVLV